MTKEPGVIPILFEDNHLLVVNKPCGMATMGDDVRETVHQQLCDYLRTTYHKPGKVFLGVVHRLDALASGVLVMARTSKAASRLSEQFRRNTDSATKPAEAPTKCYLLVVEPSLQPTTEFQLIEDRIRKNESLHRMEIASPRDHHADLARLQYRVLGPLKGRSGRVHSLVQVQLLTGRKHQIRVQMASREMPIVGDLKYGATGSLQEAIALHAWKLTIEHPTLKQAMTFTAPVAQVWKRWFPDFAELVEEAGAGA